MMLWRGGRLHCRRAWWRCSVVVIASNSHYLLNVFAVLSERRSWRALARAHWVPAVWAGNPAIVLGRPTRAWERLDCQRGWLDVGLIKIAE
jgi:hypothetical protein